MAPCPTLVPFRCPAVVALLALAAVGPALGCASFKTDPTSGTDAQSGVCGHRAPPPRPTTTDGGGALDLVFAVSESTSGTSSTDDAGLPQYKNIGFDLDDTCTNEGEGPGCVEPAWATADHTDGKNGIDNASGQIWWMNTTSDSQSTMALFPTALLRVSSYSGEPDDDQVDVSFYLGLLVPREDGGGVDGGDGPLWDGRDRWNILSEVLLPPSGPETAPYVGQPKFYDNRAYVSGGVLVAQFADALWSSQVTPNEPNLLVQVHQLVLAGSLTQVGTQWELHGVVTGMRIGVADALRIGAVLNEQGTGIPLCQDPAGYLVLKQQLVCPYVDIASVPGPRSALCDAVSLGLLLEAKPALLGDVLAPLPPPAITCAPGIDPGTDTCDPAGDP